VRKILEEKIQHGLEVMGLDIDAAPQVDFLMLMAKWNKAYNLTSVRDPELMVDRHILDSLAVKPLLTGERFIDVGTGPGLPGLPLAIAMPDTHFCLLDSNGKRTRFMFQTMIELGLKNVEIINSRVEAYQPTKKYDGVLSRAFASLSDMLTWCEHLPSDQGRFYALKAHLTEDELSEVPKRFNVLKIKELNVFGTDRTRHLVEIVNTKGEA